MGLVGRKAARIMGDRMPGPFRSLGIGAVLLGLLLATATARAQQYITAPPACVRSCAAATSAIRVNPAPVQACLIRCAAGQNFQRNGGQAALTGRGAPAHDPNDAALRGPTGQRLASIGGGPYTPQVRGLATPSGSGRSGAVYLAPAPSGSYGITYGMADRIAAHGQAERRCQAQGTDCRLALEFTDRCGAVAQARRSNGVVRTADPSTYTITFAAGGAGPSREAAESQAMASCGGRDRTAACAIVASGCGG
ncbi:MAG: hypothetical protein AVDCRST_MAG27-3088 [uncultured Craurococcus sp.]|uniref:DUF4189 domain-containing protein n=1 Tax=uncultured Craurococcus sp. TaxID=1135998 RepID=A0A6J4J697_9PROT|nr:MAG: hypothetical protein AVDCRST_MAG27-3088 [uncultured Craurococcus sp.]